MSDIERIARVAAEECSRVWRSEWVRVIAEKDADMAHLKALLKRRGESQQKGTNNEK